MPHEPNQGGRRKLMLQLTFGLYLVLLAVKTVDALLGHSEPSFDAPAILRVIDRVSYLIVPVALMATMWPIVVFGHRPWARRFPVPDAVTRSNRAVALQCGYWALFVSSCVLVMLVALVQLSATGVLFVLILIGSVTPALAFFILDRRASRSDASSTADLSAGSVGSGSRHS